MTRVRTRLLLLLAPALVILAAGQMAFSSASYTSASQRSVTVAAAQDWTPPTATVASPGSVLSGSVEITATAADSRSTLASVAVQHAVADGSTWTTICTDTTAPWGCTWNTTTVGDGGHQLRAVATDAAGNAGSSDPVTTRVANSVAVVLTPPASPVRGTVPLAAHTLNISGQLVTSLRIEHRSSAGTWLAVPGCANTLTTTLSCTWATSGADMYDLRAVAVVGLATYHDIVTGISVDNIAPTVTLTVPAGTLSGLVDLGATTTDEDSGVNTVLFEYRRSGAATWTACGTDPDAPFVCRWATTTLANGTWELRATATDWAGNATTTAVVSRVVDNTVASTSIASPLAGTLVRGTVTVVAEASSPQAITSVAIQARTAGGSFGTVCVDTTSPWSCDWNTVPLASGAWELRSLMTQSGGATVTSPVIPVTVDNAPLRAEDVQATNVGTLGRISSGDRITLTYSGVVALSTIRSGWTGAATPLTAVLKDKAVAGGAIAGYDRLELLGVNLGQVTFVQNYISKQQTDVPATMAATTATVGGIQVTVVTITLGAPVTTTNLRTATASGAMRWTPSSLAATPAGVTCSTTPATETGTADRDL